MGKIYFKKYAIDYDEAENKTILEIFHDNKIYINAPCGGNKTCKKCKIKLISGSIVSDNKIIKLTNTIVLACDTIPFGDMELQAIDDDNYEIEADCYNISDNIFNKEKSLQIGIAIDLGTTTIVLYFFDLILKKLITVKTDVNEQRSYGADVISRIKYYCDNDKNILQDVIIQQINKIVSEVCKLYGFEKSQIIKFSVAGNTVMEHLFSGLDVTSIGEAPYTPESLFGIEERAVKLGLDADQKATVFLSPCVSGFVGGDITAGLLSCNFDKIDRTILFIDIGTNGEIALKVNGLIYCCATAAGPAFEGAHISCGMGGQSGAVSEVFLDNRKKVYINVINNIVSKGICGSGLIDAVAVFLDLSEIDETGKIVNGEEIKITENVILTQKDIREIQLAKSAICAGILALINYTEISIDSIDEVLLAGGFGAKINPENACKIGLIPMQLLNKIKAVGNTSGTGATEILLKPYETDRLQDLAESCKYIELSENDFFNEEYINQMMF